ncbi:MAG: iron-containing alcohol dehydrogenase [Actinomycetota bacterium]|nr:iron-containing alcohol dehydrogenase [Actinomycetota bacterium]
MPDHLSVVEGERELSVHSTDRPARSRVRDLPQIFFSAASDTENQAGERLARRIHALDVRTPYVVASRHGRGLVEGLGQRLVSEAAPYSADQVWARGLARRVHASGADAVVGIGGGRCLDVAKLAASIARLPFIAVPTQISHDGICSPVAVVPDDVSTRATVPVAGPQGVFISIPTLMTAPLASVRAGIGDILSNPLALRDWELAATLGLDDIDRAGWELSVESFQLIESILHRDVAEAHEDPEVVTLLANALVVSGMSMMIAESSRPASGAEHKISHAIDEVLGGRALHGQQVAFGCIISAALHGEDPQEWRRLLRRLGLPDHPRDLSLTEDELVAVILAAPATRPRFTVLEHVGMDHSAVRRLVRSIWS